MKTRTVNVYVEESSKRVPVAHETDVVVAGGGVAGVFAAVASARYGADTVMIDRFGSPGGNMGPGLITGGGFHERAPIGENYHLGAGVYGDLTGIPREFIERYASLGGGSLLPYRNSLYMRDANIASHVALVMLEEAGVRLLLSTYVADPIMDGNRVDGVFIENKSGRRAVTAHVTIDATGEGDLARRAGAPVLYPKKSYNKVDKHAPNGMGIWAVFAGIDCEKYAREVTAPVKIEQRELGRLGKVKVAKGLNRDYLYQDKHFNFKEGIAGMRVQLIRPFGEYDPGNGDDISGLERKIRMYIFDVAQSFKQDVPGFENVYVLFIAPYLGTRGGPCVEGEYTLTMDDCKAARRFDDVIYLYGETRALAYNMELHGEHRWTDLPYRVMVPKTLDGMLAVGRSASGIPDTLLRNRMAVMHMGQAGGTAAALCIKNGTIPRDLDVKELQRTLVDAGFCLGNLARLQELKVI